MKKIKIARWVYDENSYTFWYKCSRCNYGEFDGSECSANQTQYDTCPKCKSAMWYR
jgi:hypothetical protein